VNNVVTHLEKPGSCVRIMFYDFSSAFNTIQPHVLCDKLLNFNISPTTILWILDYLYARPQFVKLSSSVVSDVIKTYTGAPQGTVLSPFLFSLYTSDCRATHNNCSLDKYADDTVLTGLITDNIDTSYTEEVDSFVDWCARNHLVLNVEKTKEMIIDFRKNKGFFEPITIQDRQIERVDSYKYLGVVIDKDLTWTENTDSIIKKLKPRMYCLRKLRSFNVNTKLLEMFYSSILSSVLSFGISVWGGNITKKDTGKLDTFIRRAGKVVGEVQDDIDTLLRKETDRKTRQILDDETHPLRYEYDSRLIERSGRHRVPHCKTDRYKKTFIPRSIIYLNETFKRN